MRSEAEREKRAVAFLSVSAAILLTATKLAVGLWTNSLGILSEAAHSGLDLLAAGMTFWAVSVSGRPADEDHAYGHGKVENLSALFETLLLLLTTVWIVWEALERLFFLDARVEVNVWSFLVIGLSLVVNTVSSRALKRAAVKHSSQALEADALHFSTDVWSSWVVIVGLAGVLAAQRLGLPVLAKADAVAAMGVALIVLWVCWQLGKKSVDDLLDATPKELHDKVSAAARVEGVSQVRQVRVRRSGPAVFADVIITVSHDTPLERAHETADRSEAAVRAALPGADVLVHVEPSADDDGPLTMARVLAARHGLGAHGIRVIEEDGQLGMELHLEVRDDLSLDQAHALASRFEADLRGRVPRLSSVVTHIEPAGECRLSQPDPEGEKRVVASLERFAASEKSPFIPHELKVSVSGEELSLSLHCIMAPQTAIKEAHDFTVRLEKHLRAAVPELGRVVIHAEPPEAP
ncbi:MAG: cation diffusion facilitator family transporter [Elusimicrobia bacterium]|nr:cation diffusion facilitator family transporter [Elusimicrobiota bacterium]